MDGPHPSLERDHHATGRDEGVSPQAIRDAEGSATSDTSAPKYRYLGHIPSNRSAYVIIDNLKLQPWSMTDDQVDKLLQLRPDLRHRWEVIG